MKDKKLFKKILIYIGIIFIIILLILFILGKISRNGYLSDFKLISSDNNIYKYSFRIKYYNRIFVNSDIYGVYLNNNSLPDYIINIEFQEKGSPFGVLNSNKTIDVNVDNIIYNLKIKFSFYVLILLIFITLNIFIYILINNIFYLQKFLSNINSYICILIIFLCFLIMPNIIYFLFESHFDNTNYENRLKAQKPVLSINNLGNYPIEYEKYFNDYIPFRNELVKLKNITDLFIFRNFIPSTILLGKNKWLFHKWVDIIDIYIGNDIFSDCEFNYAKNILLNFGNELNKRNIDFMFMIFPEKSTIYDIYMPDYVKRKSIISPIDKFVNDMNAAADINIIYPKKELLEYKDKYQLYYKYDSHWNKLGAYIAYTVLCEELSLDFIEINDLTLFNYNNGHVNYYDVGGDLTRMLSFTRLNYFHDQNVPVISNYISNEYKIIEWKDSGELVCVSTRSNFIDKTILFVKDSYMADMIPYIAPHFKKTIYINNFSTNFNYNFFNKENVDIVIFETVERELKRRISHDFFNKLLSNLNKNTND